MDLSREELFEKRRNEFIKRYEEAFGEKPELKPRMTDEEKLRSGEYYLCYNVYGIKSNWI